MSPSARHVRSVSSPALNALETTSEGTPHHGSAVRAAIADGTITGGMIPKVEASMRALGEGVKRIVIGGYETNGDLASLADGTTGTTIAEEDEQRE